MKSFVAALCGLMALVYLLNPTAGVFELIPDNLPIIGNMDEAVACYVLLGTWKYFKGEKSKLFGVRKRTKDFPL